METKVPVVVAVVLVPFLSLSCITEVLTLLKVVRLPIGRLGLDFELYYCPNCLMSPLFDNMLIFQEVATDLRCTSHIVAYEDSASLAMLMVVSLTESCSQDAG